MKCLGLHNKPTAEMHPGHILTGPKEEEEEEGEGRSLGTKRQQMLKIKWRPEFLCI
jgi:hypothetical protein